MCLSIPGKVISVENEMALVDVGGSKMNIGIHLLDSLRPGDFVLIHSGFALQVISQKDAEEQLELIRFMRKADN